MTVAVGFNPRIQQNPIPRVADRRLMNILTPPLNPTDISHYN